MAATLFMSQYISSPWVHAHSSDTDVPDVSPNEARTRSFFKVQAHGAARRFDKQVCEGELAALTTDAPAALLLADDLSALEQGSADAWSLVLVEQQYDALLAASDRPAFRDDTDEREQLDDFDIDAFYADGELVAGDLGFQTAVTLEEIREDFVHGWTVTRPAPGRKPFGWS